MIPTSKDLKIGKWKRVEPTHYFRAELKILGTNILIGHCASNFTDSEIEICCRMSNVSGPNTSIPYTEDFSIIHQAWEKEMDKFLIKLFK